MKDLIDILVSDVVYLVDDDHILKMQVTRMTDKQVILENNHKFWKSTGDKVGDISANKARIYPITHPIVNELYENNINIYTVIEWLYQLKLLTLSKDDVDLTELKDKFEDLYEMIVTYNDN